MLTDETELFYQLSREHEPAAAQGLRWDDPALRIKWPPAAKRIVSDRDRAWPLAQTRQPRAHLANRCGSFTEMLPLARAALRANAIGVISSTHLFRGTHGRLRSVRGANRRRFGDRADVCRLRRFTPPGAEHADEGLQMFLIREAQPSAAARPAQIMGIARFASPPHGPRRSWASPVPRLSLGLSSRLAKPLRGSHPRPGRVPQAGSPRRRWLVGCG
jgi:hypothetical protein